MTSPDLRFRAKDKRGQQSNPPNRRTRVACLVGRTRPQRRRWGEVSFTSGDAPGGTTPHRRTASQTRRVHSLNECSDRRAPGETESAICVQRLDDSLNSAIHTRYRSLLRSSSMHEPRGPPLEVVQLRRHTNKDRTQRD